MVMRLIRTFALFVVFMLLSMSPQTAADIGTCTTQEVGELKRQGFSTLEIKDLCSDSDPGGSRPTQRDNPRSNVPTQRDNPRSNVPNESGQQLGLYCCDGFGNRRCIVSYNPGPVGSQCLCPNQGYGYMCR
jgi:hypothetical protein